MKRATAEAVACGRYMPKKPTKWGFKVIQMRFSVIGWGVKSHSWACSQVWALCCSKIGYLWSFEVYQGKRQAAAERDIGAAVVMRLTKHLPPGTSVTCDRFFTTLQLAMWLIDVGKWLIGTVMPAKVDNIPEELNYGKSGSGLKRGSSAARYMTYKGVAIWFTAWMDTKPVYLLHTVFSGGSFSGRAYRWVKKTGSAVFQRVCFWCPASFIKYNSLMGGVDTFDHLRSLYTVHLLLRLLGNCTTTLPSQTIPFTGSQSRRSRRRRGRRWSSTQLSTKLVNCNRSSPTALAANPRRRRPTPPGRQVRRTPQVANRLSPRHDASMRCGFVLN